MPPPAGSTPDAGVTVRYLAAEPPLTPLGAGSRASVPVQAQAGYRWTLWRIGRRRPITHGQSGTASGSLRFTVPPLGAGLYELALRSGAHRSVVPVIASAEGRRAAARVLVVLPSLSWQGYNPVDDDGDGVPDQLSSGDRIALNRPLVDGLPKGLPDQAALLAYLDAHHLPYQLTSDVALATGKGPKLSGHTGVILDGDFTWVPFGLRPQLLAYAGNGGRVASIGQSSLLRTAALSRSMAGPPSAAAASDPFGAHHGPHVGTAGEVVTVISDPLGIFSLTGGALTGFRGYQVISPPAGRIASLAGLDASTPGVTGFRFGRGTVVEVGLDDFQRSLSANASSQELFTRIWQTLTG
jgi:hypothetical protein